MAGPRKFRELGPADAGRIDEMMADEPTDYLRYFSAFRSPRTVAVQAGAAVKDRYAGIWAGNDLAGFYCLRGLDEGYARPSFGIYVSSRHAGQGLSRLALEDAFLWCTSQGIERIMLKVYPENAGAYRIYLEQGFVDIGQCPQTHQRMMEKVLG